MDLHNVTWRKSTYSSGGGNGDCVETATTADQVAVRDSKHPTAAVLTFTPAQWQAFVTATKTAQFDPR